VSLTPITEQLDRNWWGIRNRIHPPALLGCKSDILDLGLAWWVDPAGPFQNWMFGYLLHLLYLLGCGGVGGLVGGSPLLAYGWTFTFGWRRFSPNTPCPVAPVVEGPSFVQGAVVSVSGGGCGVVCGGCGVGVGGFGGGVGGCAVRVGASVRAVTDPVGHLLAVCWVVRCATSVHIRKQTCVHP
jgi:hypothetical protein